MDGKNLALIISCDFRPSITYENHQLKTTLVNRPLQLTTVNNQAVRSCLRISTDTTINGS